jgi:hypothetical protein
MGEVFKIEDIFVKHVIVEFALGVYKIAEGGFSKFLGTTFEFKFEIVHWEKLS